MSETYEFTAEQNNILRQLSKRMKGVAIFLFIAGGLVIVQGIQAMLMGGTLIFSAAMGAIYILMGVWTFKAGKSYEQIVVTEGNDIEHLMKANSSLLSLYNLQFWLIIIGVILVVIALFVAGSQTAGRGIMS
jgi:hypothetical protein